MHVYGGAQGYRHPLYKCNKEDDSLTTFIFAKYLYNKTRHSYIYIYMLPIAGRTAGPNGWEGGGYKSILKSLNVFILYFLYLNLSNIIPLCLSIYLSLYFSIYLFLNFSIYLSLYFSIYLFLISSKSSLDALGMWIQCVFIVGTDHTYSGAKSFVILRVGIGIYLYAKPDASIGLNKKP